VHQQMKMIKQSLHPNKENTFRPQKKGNNNLIDSDSKKRKKEQLLRLSPSLDIHGQCSKIGVDFGVHLLFTYL
jgi:hypothetical protein